MLILPRALLATVGAAALLVPGLASANGVGSIKGTITLKGKAPERKELNMKADPFCAKQAATLDEDVMVGPKNGLKNVVVRIAKGLAGAQPAPATPAVLDQKGCMYRPRVVVAQAGQQVHIKNSDQTLHNVHTYKGPATLFNKAQIQGMPDIKTSFPTVGDVIKFKCDVHPWMTGYVVVTDNPFFTVTGDDGGFTLDKVPAGKYTVEVWHEKLGTQTKEVTVAPGKAADLNVELAAK